MIGWLKSLFGKKDLPQIEERVPHESLWPIKHQRDEARIGRLIEAINQYKAQNPDDPRIASLRDELERRLTPDAGNSQ